MRVKKFNSNDIDKINTGKFEEIGKVRLRDGTELKGGKLKQYLVDEVKKGKRTITQLDTHLENEGVTDSQKEKREKVMRILRNVDKEVPKYLRDLDTSYEHEKKDNLNTGVSIHDIRQKSGSVKSLKVDTFKKEKKTGIDPISGSATLNSGGLGGLPSSSPNNKPNISLAV